ncbi:MAG: DNA primase small subunit domain-containing protein [Nitrososphaeraceae archaeon]
MNNIKNLTNDALFVRSAFREYYFNYSEIVEMPSRIKEREFGCMKFQTGMIRHLSFNNIKEVYATLIRDTPSDFYCSNAYYNFPSLAMQDKEWKGADLIFDIDAKDLVLPCESSHRYTICGNCGKLLETTHERCSICKTCTVRVESIPCSNCFAGLRKEVNKLIDILTEEIGIPYDNIGVYFSGNSGFHLYIHDVCFQLLDSRARSDLAGYILGNGIRPDLIGVRKLASDKFSIKFPRTGFRYGWSMRLARKLRINHSSASKLTNFIHEIGGYESFSQYILKYAKEIGIKIDPQVTIDVHRIFRHGGTLNGKSGLSKLRCLDVNKFDPLNDACLLGEKEVEVYVKPSNLKLKLKRRTFSIGPEKEKLPTFAAVYLICKGLATTI